MTWPRATRGIPNNKRNQDRETFSTVVEGNWLWNMGKREGDVKYLQWFLRGERSWCSHRKCWRMGRQLRESKACCGLKFHLEFFSLCYPQEWAASFQSNPEEWAVSFQSNLWVSGAESFCACSHSCCWFGSSSPTIPGTKHLITPISNKLSSFFYFFFLLSHENQPYIHMQLASPCSKITLSLLIISSGLHWTSVT